MTRLAVLIDADNAQATLIKELLDEVARYGTATVKRAYGDWTTSNLKGWKAELHQHAIQPMQQFRYTEGKNSTDSALIIDAMDLLHSKNVDGFCIVSSDSDFTRLATRIREAGLIVYGFGQEQTPEPFRVACNKFVFVEILRKAAPAVEPSAPTVSVPKLRPLLIKAVEAATKEDGWAALGAVGSTLQKIDSSFDERNYGFKKLGDLMRKQSYFEIREQRVGNEGPMNLYVRLKQQ